MTANAVGELLSERRQVFIRIAKRYAPPDIDPEDCAQDAAILALTSGSRNGN